MYSLGDENINASLVERQFSAAYHADSTQTHNYIITTCEHLLDDNNINNNNNKTLHAI